MGAASAAGVPKPLAPSMRKAKAQPMIMSCATGFGLTELSQARTVFMAPVCSIVLNSKIAPQMMKIGISAVSSPEMMVALVRLGSLSK